MERKGNDNDNIDDDNTTNNKQNRKGNSDLATCVYLLT